ncbi:secreted protein containing duf1588 : Uncharacterized protein OS=Chthoniobacter flavus Ellin428 GN=CfE428DRAFT_4339 PE=4 SV=1: PSD3: PSD5: PSD4: PSCyt3: PSD2 [Gemmataceae bacterium]|nr:secreted protein containing duf1588 : Uncharacterized protein OS=Chthoniobacter flavus Ellin428 GN=CfE428DRAFT_4339 PE=4 SV=1: PSD3: PSD5: PSD4: PSCyt3: PSD2 [Gemmataceae bacterium]VTU02552.1 secreted protein containing duf1588 : Uncharacterized protein OS=Chthoniobacter flavus Ellin428 GN=CfE428DRAFT_4339 PE=4 SV=1: PSD3: PSD5: PSD4: PSCyt3: PSD2 [Gemmataceae bacterium]
MSVSNRNLALVLGATLCVATPRAAGSTFINDYCVSCHDGATRAGGLDLEALGPDLADGKTYARWVEVYDRVDRGEMPPKKRLGRDDAKVRAFLADLDGRLQRAGERRQRERGRVRLRRMTRLEFQNTLKDVLALPHLDVVGLLPADGRVAGYDKIAGGLDLSPAHLAGYQDAAEHALDLAVATRSTPPPSVKVRVYPAGLFKFAGNIQQGQFVLLKDMRPDPSYPPRGGYEGVRGYIAAADADADLPDRRRLYERNRVAASRSAVGLLNPNLAGYEAALNVAPVYAGTYRLALSLWGFQWDAGAVGTAPDQAAALRAHPEGKQQDGGRLLGLFTAPALRPNVQEFTAWVGARESIVLDPVSLHWRGLRVGQVGGRAAAHKGPGVALDWFEIEGPLNPVWPPESHTRLFGDLPIAKFPKGSDAAPPRRDPVRGLGGYRPDFVSDLPPAERAPPLETVQSDRPVEDARRLLGSFLPRALRRDVSPREIEPYLRLLQARVRAGDCFEDAMRRVYVAVLTSPEFLFLPGDARDPGGPFPTDAAFALASRLSYWLWNGPPDADLLAAARDGSLRRPEVLRRQVDRLLADRRSDRFVEDFTDQWLEMNRIDETAPDPGLYPEYHVLLREGMAAETRAFVRELIARDLPATALVRPGFAMLTQRLAEHYGVAGVSGVEVRKVPLPADSLRGGLLGQAAVHKVTANGTTTTPVKRGVWVADRLFNDPPPPPPPSVAGVDPDTRGATTIREQLDRHRANASCAACHAKTDPPGFALEAFDPIGGHRTRYRSTGAGQPPPDAARQPWVVSYKLGPPVDPAGELSDGRRFGGPADLAALLAADPDALARAFVAHLSRYATGADVAYADRAEVRRIVDRARDRKLGLRSLIHELAQSRMFFPHTENRERSP